jgi:hypothetical protein
VAGTIVTMMNPRHVRGVLIAGKVVYWKGKLVGRNVDALLRQIEQARDSRASRAPRKSAGFPPATTVSASRTGQISSPRAARRGRIRRHPRTCCDRNRRPPSRATLAEGAPHAS